MTYEEKDNFTEEQEQAYQLWLTNNQGEVRR